MKSLSLIVLVGVSLFGANAFGADSGSDEWQWSMHFESPPASNDNTSEDPGDRAGSLAELLEEQPTKKGKTPKGKRRARKAAAQAALNRSL